MNVNFDDAFTGAVKLPGAALGKGYCKCRCGGGTRSEALHRKHSSPAGKWLSQGTLKGALAMSALAVAG